MVTRKDKGLTIIASHPIQYYAPIYRMVQQCYDIPVTVIYGSDFSVVGYYDKEFGVSFSWDVDLLSGYTSIFLSKVKNGGGRSLETLSARRLDQILRDIAPKAVLLTGYSPWFHGQAFWYVRKAGYPIIFRGESTDCGSRRGLLKRWVRDQVVRWIYRQCTFVLYVGLRAFEHCKRLGCQENKLIFSPHCVGTDVFKMTEDERQTLRNQARFDLGLNSDETVLLFSGKLVLRKAPDLLLKAVRRLVLDGHKRLTVVFLGDGTLRESLKQLADEEPKLKVCFVGFQNQKVLSRFYYAADILVLPSRVEGWGMVVYEGLHHGLPCVVSDIVSCVPDLVETGVTGEIFESGSVESLSLAITRALDLVGRLEIRERCRQKVNHYTVERAAKGIAEAYSSLV